MKEGDKVKVILDDEQTPDAKQFHGRIAEIVDIEFDDAGSVTGDSRDNFMYSLRFKDGEEPNLHFRRNDIMLMEEYREKTGADEG